MPIIYPGIGSPGEPLREALWGSLGTPGACGSKEAAAAPDANWKQDALEDIFKRVCVDTCHKVTGCRHLSEVELAVAGPLVR